MSEKEIPDEPKGSPVYSLLLVENISRGSIATLRDFADLLRDRHWKKHLKFWGSPMHRRCAFFTQSPLGVNIVARIKRMRVPVKVSWAGRASWEAGHLICKEWSEGGTLPKSGDEVEAMDLDF